MSKPVNVLSLGEIYSQELEERLTPLQAQLKYLLENFPNTNDDNTLDIKRSVRATRQQASVQADNLNRISRLLESGAATYPEYAQACNQYGSAASELERMKEGLSTGVYIRRGLLDTEVQALEDQKNKRTLTSVAAGGVIPQIHAVPSQYVTQGDTLMELADPDTTVFLAYVRPKNLESKHFGQKVTISLPDGRKISAEISSSMLMTKKLPSELQSSLESDIPKLAMPVALNPLEPVTKIPYGAHFRVRFGFTVF